jgi:hypothetical protein
MDKYKKIVKIIATFFAAIGRDEDKVGFVFPWHSSVQQRPCDLEEPGFVAERLPARYPDVSHQLVSFGEVGKAVR